MNQKQRDAQSKATRNRLVLQGDEAIKDQFRKMAGEVGNIIRRYASPDPKDPSGQNTVIKPAHYRMVMDEIDSAMNRYYPVGPGRDSALGRIIKSGKIAAFTTPVYEAAQEVVELASPDPELMAVMRREATGISTNGRNSPQA